MAIELRAPHQDPSQRSTRTASAWAPVELLLIDGFELRWGGGPSIGLPFGAQRLIALLALRERAMLRSQVAGTLWPDATEGQAGANLRSTLWRVRRSGCSAIRGTGARIELAPRIRVDLRDTYALARRVLAPGPAREATPEAITRFERDLLPDWYEDWVQPDRERFRQIRLHALERLSERLAQRRLFAAAIEAALSAIAGEPLRESAHRALIRVYLMEGNSGEAIRQYHSYERLLGEELGIPPSADLRRLVADRAGTLP